MRASEVGSEAHIERGLSRVCFQVGKFDPLTRATLYLNQVVPNLALKEAVQAYLKEHGWAYK